MFDLIVFLNFVILIFKIYFHIYFSLLETMKKIKNDDEVEEMGPSKRKLEVIPRKRDGEKYEVLWRCWLYFWRPRVIRIRFIIVLESNLKRLYSKGRNMPSHCSTNL